MFELVAIGLGGAALISVVVDIIDDKPQDYLRGLAYRLERSMNRQVDIVDHQLTKAEMNTWLREHAGTTDVSKEDREFFAEQLKLARGETT